MQKRQPHLVSYLAALVIGVILFAVSWKIFFGTASSPVVVAGIAGVAVGVIIFLISSYRKSRNHDN